jgi:hypothetical protein
MRIVIVVVILSWSSVCTAFSGGSPVCEVNSLPLQPMSPVLADPPPIGWGMRASSLGFSPGRPIEFQVFNTDPNRRARGVLIWAKAGPQAGSGRFLVPSKLFQYLPAFANCGEWALSHTSSAPKPQSDLLFTWEPPASGSAFVRAFIIDDCQAPNGCRAHQALTEPLILEPVLFLDGFEP